MQPQETLALSWEKLLLSAVQDPGILHAAYRRFWNYSLGNQLWALLQCQARGIQSGPLASFRKWKELGRSVKKGEKALMLLMPVTVRTHAGRNNHEADANAETEDTPMVSASRHTRTIFVQKRNWFVVSQTEGADYDPPPPAEWNEAQALATLEITREEFSVLNGNAQGYASPGRAVAVSPVAALPHKTLFHEIAHILLGHTEAGTWTDSETISRNLQEVEAESVALLCCASLGLAGTEFCRGYIQHWLSGDEIPERSARRIFTAADRILKAGSVSVEDRRG